VSRERIGTCLLVAAIVLVALSIVLDGTVSRMLNGLAGMTWFASAGFLVLAARQRGGRVRTWLVAVGLTVLVAFVVTPSDFLPATVGFGLAGMVIALVAGRDETLWARVIVGLYLPLHVGTAMLKAAWRAVTDGDAAIRTDPPPTAALVPAAMLLAAVAGALLVQAWQRRSSGGRGSMPVHAAK
jgi:hypothetical protein